MNIFMKKLKLIPKIFRKVLKQVIKIEEAVREFLKPKMFDCSGSFHGIPVEKQNEYSTPSRDC